MRQNSLFDFSADLDSRVLATLKNLNFGELASIIIPCFEHYEYLIECLASVLENTPLDSIEIVIADDASNDDRFEVFRSLPVKYVRADKNEGFVKNCNRAAKQAEGRYLIFLNNDTQVQKDWFKFLMESLSDPGAGAVGPLLLFPDGKIQENGCKISETGVIELIDLGRFRKDLTGPIERNVDHISGACYAVAKNTFIELGGFDEVYGRGYFEDVDLSMKIRKLGKTIKVNARSEVVHHLSASSDTSPNWNKIEQIKRNQVTFVNRWATELINLNKVRKIAFYLPQFHTIPENDLWWGTGFTEWTNVSKAKSQYEGHIQPRLPTDLGFYTATCPEVLSRQARLAARFGVDAFCFYYYNFEGKRLLERPLDLFSQLQKPDVDFCICWANEPWTRRWDGQQSDVLMHQRYSKSTIQMVAKDMSRYLMHPSYLKVDGKPLIAIYRAFDLPDVASSISLIRDVCRKEGLDEIFVCYVETFDEATAPVDPKEFGFDASIEFPPHGLDVPLDDMPDFKSIFSGRILDYKKAADLYMQKSIAPFLRFRGIIPSWDNTARRGSSAHIFHGASPTIFQEWLAFILRQTLRQNFGDERLIFINAWNEWAEGAYLEPDQELGFQRLISVALADKASKKIDPYD